MHTRCLSLIGTTSFTLATYACTSALLASTFGKRQPESRRINSADALIAEHAEESVEAHFNNVLTNLVRKAVRPVSTISSFNHRAFSPLLVPFL
jgi:hypothetical protein